MGARPYAAKLKELSRSLSEAASGFTHPLLQAHPEPRRAVVIVLTSDRGLCGAFNANVIRVARTLIADLTGKGRTLEYIVQGKKGVSAFKFLGLPVAERLLGISDKPTYARAESITAKLLARFEAKEIDEVYVVYSGFRAGGAQADGKIGG